MSRVKDVIAFVLIGAFLLIVWTHWLLAIAVFFAYWFVKEWAQRKESE